MGSVVVSLGIAFALWFVVQHRIRKRRGYPPWLGVIAIGVSAVLAVLDFWRGAAVSAAAACAPVTKAWGTAPAGWTYEPADAATRAKILELMKIDDADVRLARHGGTVLLLLGVPHAAASYIDGYESGAREAGAKVTRSSADRRALEYPNGTHVVVGLRGCNAVMIGGQDTTDVDTLARAVFR